MNLGGDPIPGASPSKNSPPKEIGINREQLDRIDSQVTDRLVIGKLSQLREPVVIHGAQFLPANYNGGPDWLTVMDTGEHRGNDTIPKRLDKDGKFEYMLDRHLFPNFFPGNTDGIRKSQAPLDLPYMSNLSLLWGTDVSDPKVSRVGLEMPVRNIESFADGSKRSWGSGRVLCSLPTPTTQELVELIRKNPVNAEGFLQTVFSGVERIYQRTPVTGVLLWDMDKYLPADVQNYRDRNELFNKVFRKRFNPSAITAVSYGNAGPFPSR